VFPKTYDLERDIDELYKAVQEAAPVRDLVGSAAWQIIEENLLRLVAMFDETIVSHASDPVQYRDYLIALRAQRDAYLGFVGLVVDNAEKYDTLMPKLKERLRLFKAVDSQPRVAGFQGGKLTGAR
jgi:hypothetical protein